MAIDPVRLKQLFQGAIAIPDREQRAAWLVQECGEDADLLAKLKALLIARDDPASFLDRLAPPASSHTEETGAFTPNQEAVNSVPLPNTQEKPGHVVGRYKLLETIGEGGMGSVWMAEQREPVKRLVALKLIKAGMDTQAVLTRFEAERQALALMDHPNIAKVLDGGTTELGRPFFVMELVKGLPLTEYCDSRKLNVKDRLQLFIQICSAVQHAHQKGIIHRDLKPSNVLVTEHDGRPVPKVIDFGLAKALNATNMLTDRTLHTAYGTVVGTPLYMAPEQVGINALDTDTRSDVYALGVMLYELLTGTTPLEKQRFKQAAWDEVKRIIQEEEPPKPSMRLSSSDTLPSLAANRQIEPAKLSNLIKGELDWIVMKALEKDRNRRYETANGFSRDIQRYLADEMVEARPPSAGYRLKKFVKRNKGMVATAGVVLATILAGIAGTTWGMLEAKQQESIAKEETREKEKAREAEQQQRQLADSERKKAFEFRDRAVAALQATTGEDVENLLGEKPTLTANEKAYLEAIVKRWKTFAEQEGSDEQSRALRAEGYFRIGVLIQKLGNYKEAKTALDEAAGIQEKLAADFHKTSVHRHALVVTTKELGRVLHVLGEDQKAIQAFRQSVSIGEKLVEEFPADDSIKFSLANSQFNLAYILDDKGHWQEAELIQRHALGLYQQLLNRYPGEPKNRMGVASCHWALARAYMKRGQNALVDQHFQDAVIHYDKLIADHPRSFKFRSDSTFNYRDYGSFLRETGRADEALQFLQKALAISEGLSRDYPGFTSVRGYLANAHFRLGITYRRLGKVEKCFEHLQKAIAIQEKELIEHPELPFSHRELAISYSELASAYAQLKQWEKSLDYHRKAIVVAEKMALEFGSSSSESHNLAVQHGKMAMTLEDCSRRAEALEHHQRSLAIFEKLTKDYPHSVGEKISLAGGYCNLGKYYTDVRQYEEAIRWFNRGIEVLLPITENAADRIEFLRNCYFNRASAMMELERFQESDADYLKAIELSPPRQKNRYRILRDKMLVQCGRSTEAVVDVESVSKSNDLSAMDLYNLAVIYAAASEEESPSQIKYANRAVTMLERAVQAGYQDRNLLKRLSESTALRDREDVRVILESIEKKPQQTEREQNPAKKQD